MQDGGGRVDRPQRRQDGRGAALHRHSYLRAGAKHRAHPGSSLADVALPVRRNRLSIAGSRGMTRSTLIMLIALLPLAQACVPLVIGGAATGVAVAQDRRTAGTMADDESIEAKASGRIRNRYGDD